MSSAPSDTSYGGTLDAILLALRTAALPADWRLVAEDVEQGVTLTYRHDARLLVVELEEADASRPAYAVTSRFNVYYAVLGRPSDTLSADERRLLDGIVETLRAAEDTLPASSHQHAGSRVQFREIRPGRLLVEERPGEYYANPYVGCLLACTFCYAIHRAAFSRSLRGLPIAEWGRWLDVKTDAPEVLAREVRDRAPGVVRMSPIVTDPYQPVERKYRVMRGCLESLAGTPFSPVVLTRSSLVLRDLDVLARCHAPRVGMSIPTDDDAMRVAFEPETESIAARVDTLKRLAFAGITTFAIVQPMLPLDPDRLAEMVGPHVTAVRVGPMFEKQRASAIAKRLGRTEMLDPSWEHTTAERLKHAFLRRGVVMNPETKEWSMLR